MSLVIVTPGYTFSTDEPVTYAKLNALGQPVVSLSTGLFNILSAFKNAFINGNMQVWERGTSAKSCTAATKTWRADRWFARPTGAAITYAQSTTVPSGSIAKYSAKLTGASSVTAVDFGQRIESRDATTNWQRERTFSAYVYNDTGASFTPRLRINTPTAADNYTSSGNQLDTALQACPSGAWTQVSATFDGATLSNIGNGAEVVLQIPDGALNAAGKSVYITQLQCEPGTVVTAQEPRIITHELLLCQRYCIAFADQVVGFAADVNNLGNKGIFTLPTTMRIKPVFDGTVGATGTEENYFTTTAGNRGKPLISGYAGNSVMALANDNASGGDWTVGAQVNITCVFSAEDQS
jgi:hypothetical protein